jgi:DNA/RNA-binding domain of Phe-tRNA-synthetase-like protein
VGALGGMLIDPQLLDGFPGLRVLELDINNVTVKKSNDRLEQFKRKKQQEMRIRIKSLDEIRNLPIFRAYRDFYWRVGIDPTKTRPAGEALARRILGRRDLPAINTLVDAYNIASAESHVAIAAFDLSSISKDSLWMRKAVPGETFLGIGMEAPTKLTGIEVVIEDKSSSSLIAIYPYRDSESTKVTEQTRDVLMMMCGVPNISDSDLENARSLTAQYVKKYCEFPPTPSA